jgi:transposase
MCNLLHTWMNMRSPAKIKPHLSIDKMFQWLQNAPDEASYKRRMAVWLTCTGNLHAPIVAKVLGVSTQAVAAWISQYNKIGPDGLKRAGRGGRRHALTTPTKEAKILAPFIKMAKSGRIPKTSQIKQALENALERKVSLPYVYRLLSRHGWNEIIAQVAQKETVTKPIDDFQKIARPWLRNTQ